MDVFDTLVWRRVPEPVAAFGLVGARLAGRGLLAEHISVTTFSQARVASEARARALLAASGAGSEVTLTSVYADLPLHLWPTGTSVDALVAVELEVEKELLLADLDVVDLARMAVERQMRVVLVSDTYFSESQLRQLLDMDALRDLEIDRIFVSSEHGVGKAAGLFDLVLQELGVNPAEVVHVGDNQDSDVTAPRRLGIRSVLFERRPAALDSVLGREGAYIRTPVIAGYGDFGLTALRAKAVQRSAADALPEELRGFWRYGAGVLGPVLTGFAEWAQHRTSQAGVSKIFCLMREGAVLAELMNVTGAYLNTAVAAEPVWLSRQVCARAGIRQATQEELATLLARRQLPTVGEFATTLGVRAEDLPQFAGRTQNRLSDPVLAAEVLDALTRNPDRRAEIVASSAALRERVVRYVRSVLPPDESLMVLADLGWGGSIQSMLQKILREEDTGIETRGLYLVTHAGALDRVMEGVDLSGFLVSNGVPGPEAVAVMRSPEILEQVCMPDFGSQVGLTADLEPVLAGPGADALLLQGVERDVVQKGVFAFQREWARYSTFQPGRLAPLHTGAESILLGILTRSVVAPTEEEARLFGTWVHDENYGSTGTDPIVGTDIVRAVRHLDPAGFASVPMGELYWPFGLAAVHDEQLARAAGLVAAGQLSWEAVSSRLETGNVEVYVDNGFGYGERGKIIIEPRRNRFGLSYIQATVRSAEIRSIRIDPATAPCLLRVDWVSVRCWPRGATDPVEIRLETPAELARLALTNCSWLRPHVLLVDGNDPQLELAVEREVGSAVYEVHVQLAYAALPIEPAVRRLDVAGRAMARRGLRPAARLLRALERRTGLPFEGLARKVLARLRAAAG
ncbi:MAG: HAD family hydrolase [Actinomycetota bacterium]|nr:HAD family hydrolase [Actinomycetota bacterium]